MRSRDKVVKRAFDIVLGTVLLLPTVPVMLWTASRILLHDGGPVFYRSRRAGLNGRPFTLYKFRTMTEIDAPEQGVSGGDKAHRITRLGQQLRASRLDELPQLFNVLVGSMSFVGPRPPAPDYAARFPGIYGEVLRIKPGITGLATVFFHTHEEMLLLPTATADETDSVYVRRCIPRKAALDVAYARNWSLGLDLYLIYLTIGKIVPLPDRRTRRMRAKAARLKRARSGLSTPQG